MPENQNLDSIIANDTDVKKIKSIVFVDSNVPDYLSLVAGVYEGAKVVVLDSSQDGIAQISDALQEGSFDAVYVVSHGTVGNLQLGTAQLNSDTINTIYKDSLQQWSNYLAPNADILLYGCNVAQGETGEGFVQQLHQLTGANIAASDDATGNVLLGGNWDLEFTTGSVTAPLPFQQKVLEAYNSVLAPFTAGDIVVLRVGTGSSTLSGAAAAVFLDEYNPTTGTVVQSIALPTNATVSDTNRNLTISATAASEGALNLSADGRYLTLAGYDATPGTSGVNSTASLNNNRIVARVDANGVVDTTTRINDAYSGNNIRSAVTDDGTRFWTGGPTNGIRYVTFGSSGSSTAISSVNSRVVNIFNGQLYVSSQNSPNIGVNTVGTGLPTTTGQTVTLLPGATGASTAYAYVLLDRDAGVAGVDTLYVADQTNGLFKYSYDGSTWTARGNVAGTLTGLTGVINGNNVDLYATNGGVASANTLVKFTDSAAFNSNINGSFTTLATAAANTSFRGVAFAPVGSGNGGGGSGGGSTGAAPTIRVASTTTKFLNLSATGSGAASGVIGDSTDPAKTLGIDFTIADSDTLIGSLVVSASSSNTSVVSNDNLTLNGTDANRNLKINPTGVGFANITVTVSDGTNNTNYIINYAASAASGTSTTHYLTGTSDGSTAIAIDSNYMLIGDDENQVLRLYDRNNSGLPVAGFDFTSSLGLTDISGGVPREVDIEASTRIGNTIYWMGSESNNDNGGSRPNRDRIFATNVSGTGANTTLSYVGRYNFLREDIIAWDQNNGHGKGANYYGLAASAADGISSKVNNGYNIEGLEMAPDNTTAYVSFRAPEVPPGTRSKALIVPVTNFTSLLSSTGGTQGSATFGAPIELDLGGRGIREIRKNDANQYLIIAGAAGDAGAAPNDFRLYSWTGNPSDVPIETGTFASSFNPEGIVALSSDSLTGSLTGTNLIQFISDDGAATVYGDGTASKDLGQNNFKKFRTDTVALNYASYTINGSGRTDVVGTSINDSITGNPGAKTLTGGAGNDRFIYNSLKDAGHTIADFTVGEDKIVLTQLLASIGYNGTNPIADGYVQIVQGSSPNVSVLQIDRDGPLGSAIFKPFLNVNNVAPTTLNSTSNFVF